MSQNTSELLRQAFNECRAGRPAAAIELASRALRADPASPDAHLLLADAHRQAGDPAAGLAVLRELARRHPNRFDAWFNQGVLADAAGDTGLAIEAYRHAAELRPEAPEPLHNLGLALLRQGAVDAAVAAHLRAVALAPERVEFALAHVNALRVAGGFDEAGARLAALATAHPAEPRIWNLLGILRRERGELDAAREAYERALALAPDHADAWHNLAALHAAGDALDAAAAAYGRAVATRPGFVSAWLSLAAIELRRGRHAEARAAAERAVALAPRLAAAHRQRAVVLSWSFAREELADAERTARVALELEPGDGGAWDALCIVLRKLGRLPEAIAAGRRAVACAPGVPGHAINLGDALLEAGESSEAAAVLAAAADAAPAAPAVQRQLGIARLASGAADAGRAALERAATLDLDDQRTTAYRIAACELTGDAAGARRLHDMTRFIRAETLAAPPGWADRAAFNAELARDIGAHPSLRYEPVGLAARGGSLAQDLLAHRTPAIDAFEAALRGAIARFQDALAPDATHPFLHAIPRRYELKMWATLLDGGGEIASHIHEESWLSGAYYVALPDVVRAGDGEAGWIEFGRPNFTLPGHRPELKRIQPAEGLLLLFPSYLYHRTLPFERAGQLRVSISFDLVRRRGE